MLRLTGEARLEGLWYAVDQPPTLIAPPTGRQVTLVATGDVEWDGDRCAEVYVPSDQIGHWRAEFSDA